MLTIRRILCPVDFLDFSPRALEPGEVVRMHGRRLRDLFRFGSNARQVVRGTECPLLSVRARREAT